MKKILTVLILLLSFLLKAQTPSAPYDYEVSFYTWKYHLSWKTDSFRVRDNAGKLKDTIRTRLRQTDYFHDQFKLQFPLKKNFDSAKFVIKDTKGNQIRVVSFDIFYKCSGCEILTVKNFSGKMHKAVSHMLNTSAPGDQIFFRNIEAVDDKLNKHIPIPDIAIIN